MNFYPRFIGDWQRDTAHLTAEQEGIYSRLIDAYYATERPLPADMEQIFRIARAFTETERVSAGFVLGFFFTLDETQRVYRNARADREIQKAKARIETARANGKSGGRPKKPAGIPTGIPAGLAKPNPAKTHRQPDGLTSHNHNQSRELQHISTRAREPESAQAIVPVEPERLAAALVARDIAQHFRHEHHRQAFYACVGRTRAFEGLAYEVRILAEGGERPAGPVQPALGWDAVGEGLHALNIAGGQLTPRALRGFCKASNEPESEEGARAQRGHGATRSSTRPDVHAEAMRLMADRGGEDERQ